MNITYDFIGNANLARNNTSQCIATLNTIDWAIQQALNNAIDVSSSTIKPITYNGIQLDPIVGDGNGPQVTEVYTPGDGYGFPVGTLNFSLVSPDNGLSARMLMTVEFFDLTHVTVSLNANPSVRARFDVNNIDQTTMTTFVYGVFGSIPYVLDLVSNQNYNNINSNF